MWFETVEEAESFLQAFKTEYKISIQKRRKESRDINKAKVYWSDIGFPYLIAKTTTLTGEAKTSTSSSVISQMSSACNSSNPELLLESVKRYSVLLSEAVTFPELQIAQSNDIIRPIKWATTLLDAMKLVGNFEISSGSKFICWQRHSYDIVGKKKHIHWDSDSNLPYAVAKNEVMECHQGKDRNKARNERRKVDSIPKQLMDHHCARQKLMIQPSKKVDCKAILTITEVVKFPQYEVKTQDPYLIFQAKTAVQQALMTGDKNLVKSSEWLVQFPLDGDHSGHILGKAAGMLQPIDGRIVTKIHEMVADGVRNFREVERGVKAFVKFDLFRDKVLPDQSNRRFHPTKADIRNHYYLAFAKRKLAKLDQENVARLIDEWSECASDGDDVFFRRYVAGDSNAGIDVTSNNEDESPVISSKQTMLLVHQMAWQKRLLLRYGKDICLLDATYKTCKYALPLFFVCVKTNVGYQVVASFVLQNETQGDIEEALGILQQWNPLWKPSYFMTDKCDAEINAIEHSFAECRVLICDFHREQAWERWTKRVENGVGACRNVVLALMREVANAENEDSFVQAMENLTESQFWIRNPRLQKYFENIWLAEKERWLWLYRFNKLRVLIRTNNGVERQNRTLKQCHVRFVTDKSLSGLVKILQKDFLPEAWLKYQQDNALSSETYKKYSDNIPMYLRNRPKKLVKHCMKRMRSSAEILSDSITRSKHQFTVKSASTEEMYSIDFCNTSNFPQCSCPDFQLYFLPCKHMFAIFQKYEDVSWESFPSWYRNSVHMTLDEDVVPNVGSLSCSDDSAVICSVASIPCDNKCRNISNEVRNVSKVSENPNQLKKTIDSITNLLSEIRNVSYDVRSVDTLKETESSLKETESSLQSALSNMLQSCQHDSGLRLSAVSTKKSLKVKRKTPRGWDELPRKYPKVNRFSSRVGITATAMTKAHCINSIPNNLKKENDHVELSNGTKHDDCKATKLPSLSMKNPASGFTPHIASIESNDVIECLLRNGPHQLSLLHVKSLEPVLPKREIAILVSNDRQFKCGWLYDEIINSYMWQLCQQNKHCLYVSSSTAQVLQKKGSIKRLWKDFQLDHKSLILIPWNISGMHWVLLAVNLKDCKLLYLDPIEHPSISTSVFVKNAKELVNYLLMQKFSKRLVSVESSVRCMQRDSSSCGVFVCLYAKLLAAGKDLSPSNSSFVDFRLEIYQTICGNCLEHVKVDTNLCPFCTNSNASEEWLECSRCKQWLHCRCINLSKEEANLLVFFACP